MVREVERRAQQLAQGKIPSRKQAKNARKPPTPTSSRSSASCPIASAPRSPCSTAAAAAASWWSSTTAWTPRGIQNCAVRANERGTTAPALSVVVPVFNERDNIAPLVNEIVAALRGVVAFEIVYVDDHSRDDSWPVLQAQMAQVPELRVLRHAAERPEHGDPHRRQGGARALDRHPRRRRPERSSRHAQAAGRARRAPTLKLYAGWRVNRQDSGSKRWASKLANAIRSRLLRDDTPDTGCGIKLFEREVFLDLPYFDHMHRYLPALVQRAGWRASACR